MSSRTPPKLPNHLSIDRALQRAYEEYEEMYSQLSHDQFFNILYAVIGLLIVAVVFNITMASKRKRGQGRGKDE